MAKRQSFAQKMCDHLQYKPYDERRHGYGKRYQDVTQEEWDRASAFVDLPMQGRNGTIYQYCAKCGYKRYKPGNEPQVKATGQKKSCGEDRARITL